MRGYPYHLSNYSILTNTDTNYCVPYTIHTVLQFTWGKKHSDAHKHWLPLSANFTLFCPSTTPNTHTNCETDGKGVKVGVSLSEEENFSNPVQPNQTSLSKIAVPNQTFLFKFQIEYRQIPQILDF
jgi:hypothetical protein